MNGRAQEHYNNAVILLTGACNSDDAEKTFMLGYLADVALRAADFCARNPALVAGIDESQAELSQGTQQDSMPPVWGAGPQLPPHIAEAMAADAAARQVGQGQGGGNPWAGNTYTVGGGGAS